MKRERSEGGWVRMGWERRQRRDMRDGEEKTNEREHCFALARPSTAARRGGTRSVAAKCREIVILQSQREFTLATGEI